MNLISSPKSRSRSVFIVAIFVGAAIFDSGLAWGKTPTYGGACPSILKRVMNSSKLYRGTLLKNMHPKLYNLFEKVRMNPGHKLTPDEIAILKENQAEGLYVQWKNTNQITKKVNKELADLHRSQVRNGNEGYIKSFFKGTGKALFPMYRMFTREGKSGALAKKVLADPAYKFTDEEIEYLKRKKLYPDMLRFQEDVANGLQDKFMRISQVRTIGNRLVWSASVSGAAIGLADNKYISTEESFNENSPKGMSRYDEKVELIFLSPMPHVSVRVGGNVYNYGVMNVDRWNLDNLRDVVGFGSKLSGNHTRVELKLTEDEKDKLRDYLEEDVNRIYPLALPWVDCVSQTNKAIKYASGISVPPIANRSQALTIATLKARKFLGDDRIGDITFASSGNPVVEKSKDAVVNTLDSMMFMRYGPSLIAITPILDQFKLTLDPETLEMD